MKTKKKSGVVKVIVTLVVLALLAGGGWYAWQRLGAGSDVSGDNVVYVTKVSVLTGEGGGLGILNRFSGVIEAQETWSVEKNSEGEVAELYVKVGDEVHKGTPLFIYDVEKYQNDLALDVDAVLFEAKAYIEEKKWGVKQASIDFKDIDPYKAIETGEVPEAASEAPKKGKKGKKVAVA